MQLESLRRLLTAEPKCGQQMRIRGDTVTRVSHCLGKDDIQDKFAGLVLRLARHEFERDCFPFGCVRGWCVNSKLVCMLLHARMMLDAPRETTLRSQLQRMTGKHVFR